MRAFVAQVPQVSITHDSAHDASALRLVEPTTFHSSASDVEAKPVWLELLRDGLTFDCVGLAPRIAHQAPEVRHRFDLAADDRLEELEAVLLSPGSHLAGGGRSLPVLRGLLALARDMVHFFEDAKVACWPPAQSAIGRRFFDSTVTAWLEGGPFPALGLTAFEEESDGSLASVGLVHFVDQELRIEPELAADKLNATRLGIRLINQLVLVGGIHESERIVGPDGSRLHLRPSRNGKYVRVSRE